METEQLTNAIRRERREGEGALPVAAPAAAAATSPERTSIAVMPFRVIRADRDEDYFGESFAMDITAALSRCHWLLVLAHSAAAPYRGGGLTVVEAGRELGVHYILDGTVRCTPTQLRVSAELLETGRGRTLWAEHFQASRSELFALQDEITAKIVGQLDPMLLAAEFERLARRQESLGAHECLMRALPLIFRVTRPAFDEARELLERAIAADPDYALPYAWLGFWNLAACGHGWTEDRDRCMSEAEQLAAAALERDPNDALALAIAGHIASYLHHDYERGRVQIDRALQINPNAPFAWAVSAANRCYSGEPDRALAELDRYQQLCPRDPYAAFYTPIFAIAHAVAGRYEDAVRWGRQAVRGRQNFTAACKPLIASLGHLGRRDEAGAYIRQLLDLDPEFCIDTFRQRYPFRRAEDRDRYIEGLRQAGVPEHLEPGAAAREARNV